MSDLMYPNEPTKFTANHIDEFLKYCVESEASDVTFQTKSSVMIEVKGRLQKVTKRQLTQSELVEVINGIYGSNATA